MAPTRAELLASAHAFCYTFASSKPLDDILACFSTDPAHPPQAIEHGLPSLAPFLGRAFVGIPALKQYFTLLAEHLKYENMQFSEFVVDSETKKVSCKGHARFTWVSTGLSWDETFSYTLDFDDQLKVARYQIWADTGAAYLARTSDMYLLQTEK